MGALDRRSFLKGAAAGSVAAAVSSPTAALAAGRDDQRRVHNDPEAPGTSRGWEAPPSTLPADPADNPIEHIGVLMMENRTYDTYLGWLEHGRGFSSLGLDLTYTDPDDPTFSASPQHWAPDYRRCGHPDPDHSWAGGRAQLRDGFLAGRNDEYALAYYLAEDIPTYARLARQFTVFDRYFCSVLGPTFPNRYYQHSGQAGGLTSNQLPPDTGDWAGFPWPTIWDRLEAAGISWTYYFSDVPATSVFGPRLAHRTRPIAQFHLDAATGRLPHVYFVDPAVLGELRVDDHPGGSDMQSSQAFVNNVAHSVLAGPQWARTAFFINYDEWGGFFDHVTPPSVPDDRASDDLDTDHGQLGFRVPALVLSPYARTGHVHHEGPYEHTSILRFIEYRFDLEPLTTRTANARNIGEALDYTRTPRLDHGIQQLATPSLHRSTGCDTGPPAHDDFERLAEYAAAADLGIPLTSPTPDELFGNAVPATGAAATPGYRRSP
jgi:phospholipase C